jgi:hypothetical protein
LSVCYGKAEFTRGVAGGVRAGRAGGVAGEARVSFSMPADPAVAMSIKGSSGLLRADALRQDQDSVLVN